MLIVRAGDTEFQIPKEILLPPGDTKSRLAYLVNKPRPATSFVDLHDIDPKALDVYLSLRCPQDLAKGDVHSVQDWTLLLEFSTYMGLDSVRELAIERLDPIASPVDKIVEGTACGVDRWLVPSITELCGREKFLTLDESIRLGVRRVHLIASVRERIAGTGPHSKRSRLEATSKMVQESLGEGDDMTDVPRPYERKSADNDFAPHTTPKPDPIPSQIPERPSTSSSSRPDIPLPSPPASAPPPLNTQSLPARPLPPTFLETTTAQEPSLGVRGFSESGETEYWPERIKEHRQGKKKRRQIRAGAMNQPGAHLWTNTGDGYSDFESISSPDMDMSESRVSPSLAISSEEPFSKSPSQSQSPRRSKNWHFHRNITIYTSDNVEFCIPQELLLLPDDKKSGLVAMIEEAILDDSYYLELGNVDSKILETYLSLRCPQNLEDGGLRSVQDWTNILRFADEFELTTLRDLAVRRLTPIANAVDKVVQGRLHGVEEWIVPSFAELCLREKFLTLEESVKIEVQAVHLIASVREETRCLTASSSMSREEQVCGLVTKALKDLSGWTGGVAAKKAAASPVLDKPMRISPNHVISQTISLSNSLPPLDMSPPPRPRPNLNPLASPFVPPPRS
ncbi:uncharacterized protein STEHIDRAFT_167045 [Stereum hirsutum FP-91666 SS1]|uniref:uncharacterized protein n=1 Tax=Stereum hirsutum (strain FP-91666) TaxID=721885 RepID=UPI0004409ECC|nr:uncharacterized protein STEHIDRAFT_167045 [Stereum hirsutum FP-91666 SS1]EIM89153.1 hypothetical protein STEHIDRAFT_167045 [Stereum hirsutum FP-91666 SS1]